MINFISNKKDKRKEKESTHEAFLQRIFQFAERKRNKTCGRWLWSGRTEPRG